MEMCGQGYHAWPHGLRADLCGHKQHTSGMHSTTCSTRPPYYYHMPGGHTGEQGACHQRLLSTLSQHNGHMVATQWIGAAVLCMHPCE